MSVVVLTGGVGGAKLVDGLVRALPAGEVSAIINTADDFEHLGLRISPDIDSVFYMLCDMADPVRGWGVRDESWHFMDSVRKLGGEDWFNLGDRDLAVHVLRTLALRIGQTLSGFTNEMVAARSISANLLPMTNDVVSTVVDCSLGRLPFQEWFVKHRCEPAVNSIAFSGADKASPSPDTLSALADPTLEAVLIAPSNPYLSIDPILSLSELCEAIRALNVPVVAVSPLIGGQSVKGPTGKIMAEFGIAATNEAICDHYDGLLDGMLVDTSDAEEILTVPMAATSTLMTDAEDRRRVAQAALALARTLA